MKPKQFILAKVALATIAIVALTFTSCEKDDDRDTPPANPFND